MPDLGKYAVEVLAAWGLTGLLLGVLVLASVLRARHTRRVLERIERGGGDAD